MTLWAIGFLAGTIVTLVVAMLLIGILLQARRILGLAKVASKVVAEIDSNTDPLVSCVDKLGCQHLLGGAEVIEKNAAAVSARLG